MPDGKVIEFRCGMNGVVSKQSPDLLKDGQYRSANNIVSSQEGSISSRTGIKDIGYFTTSEPTCYFIRKLCVQGGEDPLTPSVNPRYLGILTSGASRNIYRTTDYNSKTQVGTGVDSVASRHWEMADYAAGESGTPWAYFACPNTMLKDRGASPYSTLPKWGIQPAVGVALAATVTGSINISSIFTAPDGGLVIEVAADAGWSDYDRVTLSGVTGVTFVSTDSRGGTASPNDTWDMRIGVLDSTGVVTNPTKQARLYDTNGQGLGLTGTYGGSGGSVTNVPVFGSLDGGAESSPNNTQPYDWVFCYEETDTGDKGNPSQFMSASSAAVLSDSGISYKAQPIAVHNGKAKVAVWGTADARIGFIRIYRRGGTLTDGIPRLVARVVNPGSEAYAIVTDDTADADLVYLEMVEYDNDPPVTSTVPSPIHSSASGAVGFGWQTVSLASAVFGTVTPGTLVHVIDPVNSEDVYVASATSSSFRAYFQFTHLVGTPVEVDAITGQPCNLATTFGESVLVAGDPNNPHMLYKSKTGYPQAFPVGTDAAGAVTSIGAGTPANGIVNLTECRGLAVTLNVSAVFVVPILGGSLRQPVRVSGKGLKAQSAWCKTSTEEIWYLSDDGVYSWDGAQSLKRSEAIDSLFHSQEINGMSPLDMSATGLTSARMEFRRGLVYLVYKDTAGHIKELVCEPMYGDRWMPLDGGAYQSAEFPITALYREPDTQSLIVAVNNPGTGVAVFGIADAVTVSGGVNLTSDWWTGTGSAGNYIPWDLKLPWFDMGSPAALKLYEEVWLDVDPQLYHGTYATDSTITVELLTNYSDTVVDTFNLTIPTGTSLTGRQLISLLPNLTNTSGSIYQSYGREARAISFHLYGHSIPAQFRLFGVLMQYQETGMLSAGSASDWMDGGSKHDKRLYQMAVVFDTAGTNRQIVLETRGGRDGKTAGTSQVFTLSSPTDLGSGRCAKVFALGDPTIAKLMRVRPYSAATISGEATLSSVDLFRVLEVAFPDGEEYPPDIVSRAGSVTNGKVTEAWTNGGYDYDKYAQQICFEVNTNNVAVTVQLQADGANIGSTFTITSTETDRKRNITLPPGLRGKAWSVFVDPNQAALTSSAGMWQCFNQSWKFQQADLGEVSHTKDWDDLGHPYDKRLYTLTLRWDNTGGAAVTFVLDLLSGINGGTVQSSVATFVIPAGSGRSEKNFPLPDNLIAKAVRVYPQTTPLPLGFKSWKYEFQKEPYPADIVAFTPPEDGGYEYDKFANQLDLEVNTNNVPVTVQVQADGRTVQTLTVQTTELDRRRNFTLLTGLIGKTWRLFIDPTQTALISGGGMFQLFSHRFGFQKADPGEVGHTFDWDDLEHPYDKLLLTVTFEYDTTVGGAITLQMDTLVGIGGTAVNTNFASFTLGYGRGKTTFPIAPDTVAKMVRIYPASPVPNGYKQWKYKFDQVNYPADTVRVTPWKDASAPVDKEPSWLWIDADTSGVAASVQLQSESGTVMTVSHTGSFNNRKKNYPIPVDTRAKMWRIVAAEGLNGRFQLFNWGFERWQPFDLAGPVDPPEVILATPWNAFGYPYQKIARNVVVTMNTGGVTCNVALQTNESGTVANFPVTTTNSTRRNTFAPPPNLQGTLWRLVFTPVAGGLSQLWDWDLDAVKLPPALTRWSSQAQGFGYKGWKDCAQFWLDYICAGAVNVTFTSDTGSFTMALPAHIGRAVERRPYSDTWGLGLNKSKLYGIDIVAADQTKPFMVFPDVSGIEWMPCGGDRHAAYQVATLSEFMQLPL